VRLKRDGAAAAIGLFREAAKANPITYVSRADPPFLICHGEADPLVPVAAGHDLLRRIAGAEGDFIAGMGHDLPPAVTPQIVDAITRHCQEAESAERTPKAA
jgi:predicted esterase